jgi:HlyD family secretion protein
VVAGAAWRGPDESRDQYVTAAVDRGAIVSKFTATGTVNPVTSVQVGTFVSGPILALYADFNSQVKQGQLVATIDPAPFEVKVAQADAHLANARAQVQKDRADLALKTVTLRRSANLAEQELISRSDLDTAGSAHQQAVAELALAEASAKEAEAELREAHINLDYAQIRSPVDGVVVSRNVSVGQVVAASFQTPTLFVIAKDLTKMQVDTNVSESDIGQLREGAEATFTVGAYPGRDFRGEIAQVRNAPQNIQNVVTYDVVIAADNSELLLKPGMTANVTIAVSARADALRIPLRALRFRPPAQSDGNEESAGRKKAPTVWVVRGEGIHAVVVKTGAQNDEHAEVLSGDIRPGDQLAIAVHDGEQARGPQIPSFVLGRLRSR